VINQWCGKKVGFSWHFLPNQFEHWTNSIYEIVPVILNKYNVLPSKKQKTTMKCKVNEDATTTTTTNITATAEQYNTTNVTILPMPPQQHNLLMIPQQPSLQLQNLLMATK
uniref:Uncharacterized protein n=1 Tax=Romanomermis culicivorax TaxID=13658 RepID=A0A915HSD3_ROMCU